MITLPIPFKAGSREVADSRVWERLDYIQAKKEARDEEFKEFAKKFLKVKE